MDALQIKIQNLQRELTGLARVIVAFSGGADSTLLLAACLQVLGKDNVLAVTADSPTLPRIELSEAIALAGELGAQHLVVTTNELCIDQFRANPPDRCYYCKKELFTVLRQVAEQRSFPNLLYGATADDLGDVRPGMQAAREAGATAPLLEAGFTKGDVRQYSRQLGLSTWDKPAMACLSSRFPYGTAITPQRLGRVEQAEDFLRRQLGFKQVRVRDLGTSARIEVPEEKLLLLMQPELRRLVVNHLKACGYTYVTVNLEGLRSGSLNDVLAAEQNLASVP